MTPKTKYTRSDETQTPRAAPGIAPAKWSVEIDRSGDYKTVRVFNAESQGKASAPLSPPPAPSTIKSAQHTPSPQETTK